MLIKQKAIHNLGICLNIRHRNRSDLVRIGQMDLLTLIQPLQLLMYQLPIPTDLKRSLTRLFQSGKQPLKNLSLLEK
jgi:hypothetical protein